MALVGLSVFAAALLSLHHLDAIALPGCGGASDCAKAARSPWAKVPGIHTPVAFLALAYQAATLTLWVSTRGKMGGLARIWLWVGATGSCVYIAVSFHEKLLCPYCFVVHACNLVMLGLSELLRKVGPAAGRTAPSFRQLLLSGAAGVLASLPFLLAQRGAQRHIEDELSKSKAAITQGSNADAPAIMPPSPAIQGASSAQTTPAIPGPEASIFTGRYRLGPEAAVVRVVVFSDFECPDCKRLEGEIMAKVRTDTRFSISLKQFPLSTQCNPNLTSDMHPDACWAARAAEVAGIMGGNDTFWAMCDWLFAHNGSFDEPTLRAALPALGLDANTFVAMLDTPEVNSRIAADIAEGMALGIGGASTPMIFINGVELKGWSAPNAFARVTDALLATNPPARTAAFDHPPLAREKIIADFAGSPVLTLPEGAMRNSMGPADADVSIVVFGDYLEANTRDVDQRLRALANDPAKRVRYSFQHFPFDQACNPGVPKTGHPNACVAARLAEAARRIGGDASFWSAHAWLFGDAAKSLLEQGLATGQLAQHLGLDARKLLDASLSPEVASIVGADCSRGQGVGLTSLPWILINGRVARQWTHDKEDLLPTLIEAARK